MRSAAFTIVYNDMVILELWLSYYRKHFDDLYVIGNGTKEKYGELDELRLKYHFEFNRIPLAGNSDFTLPVVKDMQVKLLEDHDWVLYSDCDEIITPDYRYYKDFPSFFSSYPKDKIYCEGYSIVKIDEEAPIDYSKPYLAQRNWWVKDPDYNKPLLSKVPLNWAPGCHRELEIHDTIGKGYTNTGMLLLHLKYADTPASSRDLGPIFTQRRGVDMEKKEEMPEEIRGLF